QDFTFEDELFFNNSGITRMRLSFCRFNPPNGASVKKLVLFKYYCGVESEEDIIDCIKINAPYISSLTIKGELFLRELVLLNVSSLVEVDLKYSISYKEFVIFAEEIFRGLLKSLGHVENITFGVTVWRSLRGCGMVTSDLALRVRGASVNGVTIPGCGVCQRLMRPRVTLGRLLPHARGLEFKPRRRGFPSGAKKEWGLSPKAKVRVLHTAQLDVTDKGGHEGKSSARTLIDIPVFVGKFSILAGFIIIDDEDVTRDFVLGMSFFMKYMSCQMVMKKFVREDKCERMNEE
nr:hypothetical protein [Tanacetum cinerariifolium]